RNAHSWVAHFLHGNSLESDSLIPAPVFADVLCPILNIRNSLPFLGIGIEQGISNIEVATWRHRTCPLPATVWKSAVPPEASMEAWLCFLPRGESKDAISGAHDESGSFTQLGRARLGFVPQSGQPGRRQSA